MQAKAKLSSYEDVEFSITLTAPVTDWRAMNRQLEKLQTDAGGSPFFAWPLSSLVSSIKETLAKLDRTHDVSVDAPLERGSK